MKMKPATLFFILLALVPVHLSAGDMATFVELGFSPDGRIYMFGQYGIRAGNLRPWAELYAVDVARNAFTDGGRLSYAHNAAAESGQDGSGAFFHLLARNSALTNRYQVSFLARGRLLYVGILDGIERETIEFRDFERGTAYQATLISQTYGSGTNLTSSFRIDVERTGTGGRRSWQAGNPQIRRSGISAYQIRRVMISPQGDALIFVIETRAPADSGYNIRYMIEAIRLQ
jgi:predicted secreted protein